DRLGISPDGARRSALVFFSNPVSVAVACIHGQFDGLAVLFLLAAVYAATAAPQRGQNAKVVFWLSISLLVKHVTAFHPLLFVRNRRRTGLSLAATIVPYVVFALSFVPFLSARGGIVSNVLFYPTQLFGASHRQRPGGLRYLIEFSRHSDGIFFAIFVGALAWALWWLRSADLTRACLVLFLTILLFLPGFSFQYLIWPIALGSLTAPPFYALFSTMGALFYFGEAWHWPMKATHLGPWVAALIWWIDEVRSLRFRPWSEVGPGIEWWSGEA